MGQGVKEEGGGQVVGGLQGEGGRRMGQGVKAARGLLGSAALVGVFIAVAPRYVFPVCEFEGFFRTGPSGEQLFMRCHQTAVLAVWFGALIAAVCVLGALLGTVAAIRACAVLALAGGVATIALPIWIAPVCKTVSMPCVAGTWPALVLAGALTAVLCAVALGLKVPQRR